MKHSTQKNMAVGMALLLSAPAWADSLNVRWSELGPVVVNRKISLQLSDGSHVRGKAIAVEPEQLIVDVRKTRQSIPRNQVTTLEVSRPTKRWRIIGTLVGAGASLPLGVVAAIEKDGLLSKPSGGTAIGIAVIGGVTAAGFLLGWAADRRTTTVSVRE